MAADLVEDPKTTHTFVHDMESAFYVVFWLSIRFLPNSWNPQKRSLVMQELFDPPAFSTVGSSSKKNWMAQADTDQFEVVENTALTGLIFSLLPFFQARHVKIDDQPPGHLKFGPRRNTLSRDKLTIQEYLTDLVDHQQVITTFRKSLEVRWPEVEPAVKQDIAIPDRIARCLSKRSKSSYHEKDIGKGGSSQKRLRT